MSFTELDTRGVVQRPFGGSLDASDPRPGRVRPRHRRRRGAQRLGLHGAAVSGSESFRILAAERSDHSGGDTVVISLHSVDSTDWSLSLWASARWSSSEGEATRMGRLVDDLLQLAELDQPTKSGVVSFGPTDHAALTLDAAADARAADPARSISFTDPPSDVLVPVDSDRLGQVLANLTDQRHRANPTRQSCRRDAEDNPDHGATRGARPRCRGPGMAADDVARIFERCYRTDSSRSR
ncbi:MAG: hypothetical protein QOD87_2321 [Pseudonocardiales bacterium]|nr:hypothetical protein [Pseudonocardiales bacterium]